MQNLHKLLEEQYLKYNTQAFIEEDPIAIPHGYASKENIEISAFLAATIAWGKRPMIVKNARRMMQLMGNDPYDFVMNFSEADKTHVSTFVHRTFNGIDLGFFIESLRNIYARHGGLERVFTNAYQGTKSIADALLAFRACFFELRHPERCTKHVANLQKGASAKRLNMFLRWMVRRDDRGVDFGLWKQIPTSALFLPLDVHTGNVSRELGLLSRKQNDWKAVEEVTASLRAFDPADPVKYDFALFGMGIFNKA